MAVGKWQPGDKRRSPGDGTSFQRADGYFVAGLVYVDPIDGKRKAKRFYAKASQAAANKKRADFRRALEANKTTRGDRARQTVADYLRRWFEQTEHGRARETNRAYRHHLEGQVIPAVGHKLLTALESEDVAELMQRYEDQPATAEKIQMVLHAALKAALKTREVNHNAAEGVRPPKRKVPEVHPPTAEQIRLFLTAARASRYWALWVLLAHTGMRPQEALGLEWRDVDWARGAVFIQRARQGNTKEHETSPLKREATSRRWVTIEREAIAALEWQRERQAEDRQRAGDRWQERGLIFTTRLGRTPYWPATAKLQAKILSDLGIGPYAPYVFFRHAHVTLLLAAGVPPQDVAWRTGHSLQTMMKVYAHRVMERDADAARRFADVLAVKRDGTADGTNGERARRPVSPAGAF